MGTIITLTTDFGLTDAYVAAMKGHHPFKNHSSPSCKEDIPIMERGIKGMRLINIISGGSQ